MISLTNKNGGSKIWRQSSLIFIFFFILFFGIYAPYFSEGFFNKTVIYSDPLSYYTFLPAKFIYHDITHLSFMEDIMNKYYGGEKFYYSVPMDNGNLALKTSMGLAYLYAPFFFMAHICAHVFHLAADGYSWIYRFFIYLGSLFYSFVGLFFLRKLLLKYFSEKITLVTLIIITIGTNYLYYVFYEGAMVHGYLFSLLVVLLFVTDKWVDTGKKKYMLWISFLAGLALLIRPTEIICLLIPVLWKVDSLKLLKKRFQLIFADWKFIFYSVFVAFLVCVPQLIYWKILTGHFVYYSYGHERFYFDKPHLYDGLLSMQKGWLIYTPIMIFAIAGFFYIRKNAKILGAILVFCLVNYYIIVSWWCWHYSGSFGMRPLVESYAFLAFPIAVILKQKKNIIVRILLSLLLAFFIFLNLFQTYQYHRGIIPAGPWMTEYIYKQLFLKMYYPPELEKMNETGEKQVDEVDFKKINLASWNTNNSIVLTDSFSHSIIIAGNKIKKVAGAYLKVSCLANYSENLAKEEGQTRLVVQFEREHVVYKYSGILLQYLGDKNTWTDYFFKCKIPYEFTDSDSVAVYLFNPSKHPVELKELKVDELIPTD